MFSDLRKRLRVALAIGRMLLDTPKVPLPPDELTARRRRPPAPLSVYMPDGEPYRREPFERLIGLLHTAVDELPPLTLKQVNLRPIGFSPFVDVEAVFMSRDGRVTQVVSVAVEQKQGKIIENWWMACTAAEHQKPELRVVRGGVAIPAGAGEPTENGASGLENPAGSLHRAADQIPND